MYESKLKSPQADTLYKAILSLKTVEECYQFFDDLCTINEINSMTQRYEVVKMLNEGTTFNAIAEATGASTARGIAATGAST